MTRVFALVLAGLLAAVTLGIAAFGQDRPALDSGGRTLTDAVTLGPAGASAVRLRISDPDRELTCTVPLSDFAGDGPAPGEVVQVVPGAAGTCELATLTGMLPRASLVVTGLLCLVGIGVYAVRAARRRRRRRAQDEALIAYLAGHPVR